MSHHNPGLPVHQPTAGWDGCSHLQTAFSQAGVPCVSCRLMVTIVPGHRRRRLFLRLVPLPLPPTLSRLGPVHARSLAQRIPTELIVRAGSPFSFSGHWPRRAPLLDTAPPSTRNTVSFLLWTVSTDGHARVGDPLHQSSNFVVQSTSTRMG